MFIAERGSTTLNNEDLSLGTGCGTFELYPTKNIYQFLLLDKVIGRRSYRSRWRLFLCGERRLLLLYRCFRSCGGRTVSHQEQLDYCRRVCNQGRERRQGRHHPWICKIRWRTDKFDTYHHGSCRFCTRNCPLIWDYVHRRERESFGQQLQLVHLRNPGIQWSGLQALLSGKQYDSVLGWIYHL